MTSDLPPATLPPATLPPDAEPCPIVAFTSPGDPGRTVAVVNVGCLLAAGGRRVLVIDQGTEAPRVHDHLEQFQADTVQLGDLLDEGLATALLSPAAGRDRPVARRYQLPMNSADIDVIAFPPGSPQPSPSHGHDAALRNRIRAAGYDHVLIDVAAAALPAAMSRLAYLCDLVAVCFHPRSGDVSKAAELAAGIATLVPFRLKILAVTLQFDEQDPDVARQTKDRVRTAFADLAAPSVATTFVEIPYQPVGVVFDQAVAVLHDEPDAPVPAVYGRIASTITAGQIDRMHPLPARVRDSYRYSLGASARGAQPRVFLAYAEEDRLWADWMQGLLESSGAKVGRLPEGDSWLDGPVPPGVLVVGNPRLARSQTGRRAVQLVEQSAGTPGLADRFDLLVVRVPGHPISAPFAGPPHVSFVDCDEALARRRLLRRLVLFDQPETAVREYRARFPGTAVPPHTRSNLPPRNELFVGRGIELEHIRDLFVSQEERVVVSTLTGFPGAGKSQLALEYAHRFTTDYDLQWWISAEDERSIRASLTALADEMKLPSHPDRPRSALEALQARFRYRRWLLIYDNVASLDNLAELLPAGEAGHVVVTTRESHPSGTTIGALDTEDSAELVGKLVPDLSGDDAALVTDAMNQMPLALRLAAAWLSESARIMHQDQDVQTRAGAAAWAAREFRTRIDPLMPEQPAGSPSAATAATLAIIVETLAAGYFGRVATRLAQMCTWLSPEGVSLRLLRSAQMVGALADAAEAEDRQALILDPLELDQVLRCGQRYGLFEINWERPAKLTMHRVVQAVLRETMGQEESDARWREVLRALAAFAPKDPEPGEHQDIEDFVELQRHIEVSDAVSSPELPIRRWLVDQVNYLMRTPSPETWDFAVDLGTRVLKDWHPVSRAESSLRMRLEFQLGSLHRQRGEDVNELLRQVDGLLGRQQQSLGPTHPRTLKTWRSKAANLRIRGQFAEACAAEQRTLRGFQEGLGDHHPDTRRAANNLALSYFYAGDVSSALEVEQENYAIRVALFGPDHLDVCWSACNMGIYLRELGRYAEAIKIFDESVKRVGALQPDGGHPDELRIRWNRAIAYRNAGNPSKALEENAENLRRYQDLYGPGHGNTARCKLSFAIDYHLVGDSAAAVYFAEESRNSYSESDPRYLYTALHRLNLAVFRRNLGQLTQATEISTNAMGELDDWLGGDHPWTLAATINHAHTIALNGDPEAGRELLRSTHEDCLDYLPPDHPYTSRVASNLESAVSNWGDLHVDLP